MQSNSCIYIIHISACGKANENHQSNVLMICSISACSVNDAGWIAYNSN